MYKNLSTGKLINLWIYELWANQYLSQNVIKLWKHYQYMLKLIITWEIKKKNTKEAQLWETDQNLSE